MQYRKLGKTDLSVSEVGFGCWGIGGDRGGAVAYGKTDDETSVRALETAFDLGVNFFDTSDFYGNGHSEELLGATFADRRERVVYASKGGMLTPEGDQDFSPEHIREAFEGSLRRLQTDYIDLYQWHSPLVADLPRYEATAELLQRYHRDGAIRHLGFSARSPQEAVAALEYFPFASVQVNFNLADQRVLETGLLAKCAELGAGVIARTPLSFGFLTDKLSGKEGFPPGDHRNRWTAEQKAAWLGARDATMQVRDRHPELTAAQFAIGYCLSYPAVSCVIPGMLTPDEVRENAGSSTGTLLPAAELDEIESIYQGLQAAG